MTISSATTSQAAGLIDPLNSSNDPLAASAAKADRRFAELLAAGKDAAATLADITKQGSKSYWEWKIKEMRKQIADQVMKEMKLTPEKIAQMSAQERVATENKILEIVEQRLRLALAEEMKRRRQSDLAISASLQSVITTAQGIEGSPV